MGKRNVVERDATKMATRVGQVFAFEFGPNPGHLSAARAFVATLAGDAGCDADHVRDLKIAVSEACTNAIRAHEAIGFDGTIRVSVEVDAHRVRVAIEDSGGGFDLTPPQAVTPVDLDVSRFARGGLGLNVIRTLFPQVRIGRNDHGGTTVTLDVAIDEPVSGSGSS